MKPYQAREMTHADLVEKLDEAKDELFNLRFQLAVSQSDNTARLGELRRDIARMRTVLDEWERDGHPLGYEEGEYEWESPPAEEPVPAPEPAMEAEEAEEPVEEEPPPPAAEEEQAEPAEDEETDEAEEPKRRLRWGKRRSK